MYMNEGWCTNCGLVKSYCPEAIELMTDGTICHGSFITIVYILPGANANEALKELHDTIRSRQTKHPEAFYVVVGDFNHVKMADTVKILPACHHSYMGRQHSGLCVH